MEYNYDYNDYNYAQYDEFDYEFEYDNYNLADDAGGGGGIGSPSGFVAPPIVTVLAQAAGGGGHATPIGPLLLVVFTSILEVFLLCLAGYILAGRGILDKKTQKQLNRLNVSLFTPALLFSKVAFFLTPEKLQELWIIPIFFCVVTAISMSIAFVLGWLFRLRKSQRSFAMAAAMFMNSNSLPIALMQSLVVTVPGLQWDKYDSKNAMLGRALTYLVMYSTLGMVLRWSYGVRLLSQADEEVTPPTPAPQSVVISHTHEDTAVLTERSPLLSSYPHNQDRSYNASSPTVVETPSDSGPASSRSSINEINVPGYEVHSRSAFDVTKVVVPPPVGRPVPKKRTTFYKSFPNSPNDSRVNLAQYDSSPSETASENGDAGQRLLTHPQADQHQRLLEYPEHSPFPRDHRKRGIFRRIWRGIWRTWAALNDFMTVPLWAALLSLIVACIGPLQHTLENHMQPVKGAISSAGKCSIPITLVVLGAYFHKEVKEGEKTPGFWESIGNFFKLIKDGAVNGVKMIGFGRKRKNEGYFRIGEEEAGLMSHRDDDVHEGEEHGVPIRNGKLEEDKTPGETKTVLIAVLSRMIITPLLLMPLMVLCARYDYLPVFEDPVFVVSNILLIASPPALTLAQITQAASGEAFERLISKTIFWSYCVVTPPTTIIFVVVGLMVAKI